MAEEPVKTSAFMCRLDDDFQMMEQYLERLKLDNTNANEFKIFCSPQSAIEFFGYPKKTIYKGMEVVPVSKYPSLVANIIRSTEFKEATTAV